MGGYLVKIGKNKIFIQQLFNSFIKYWDYTIIIQK